MAVAGTLSVKTIKGTMQAGEQISGKIITETVLCGTVSSGASGKCRTYTGNYDIVPKIEEQVLETYDRHMEENVKIRAIPYHEVTNNSGGLTATIGGN